MPTAAWMMLARLVGGTAGVASAPLATLMGASAGVTSAPVATLTAVGTAGAPAPVAKSAERSSRGDGSLPKSKVTASLDAASRALEDFRPREALALLDGTLAKEPRSYEENARYYELRGIAHAYLENAPDAIADFERMLVIDPSRAISYTLSPKVTFLFEKARRSVRKMAPMGVDLSWPRTLKVADPIPITLEILGDPHALIDQGSLFWRLREREVLGPRTLSKGGYAEKGEPRSGTTTPRSAGASSDSSISPTSQNPSNPSNSANPSNSVEPQGPQSTSSESDPSIPQTPSNTTPQSRSSNSYEEIRVDGLRAGETTRLLVDPLTAGSMSSQVVEVYFVANDGEGNQVHVLGGPDRPREIGLAYEPRPAWYERWWLWLGVGVVVALGAGTAVAVGSRSPPRTIEGTFEVIR